MKRPLDTIESMAFAEWIVENNLDLEASDVIESYRDCWAQAVDVERRRSDLKHND